MSVKTVYVYGNPKEEHLRLELEGNEVIVISHEARSSLVGLTNMRDRIFCSIPIDKLKELLN